MGEWVMSEWVGQWVSEGQWACNFQSPKQSAGWLERRPSCVRSGPYTYRPLAVFFGVVVTHMHGRVVENVFDGGGE